MLLRDVLSFLALVSFHKTLVGAIDVSTTCHAGPSSTSTADLSASSTIRSVCPDIITLTSDGSQSSIIIIDHGENVAGTPTFEIVSHAGDTSVFEMTYSETRALLDNYMSDGPLPLAASLDTYRVNRYNVTEATVYKNRLIQGGERYQKLNLSSAGELVLKNVGIISDTVIVPVTELAGSFQCSDQQLTQIWQTGARTLQLTQIPADSISNYYHISDQGLLAESQSPQPYSSDTAPFLMQYELKFYVKPVTGGFGYTVLSDTLGAGIYVFVNIANSSISAHSGSTEMDSAALSFAVMDPVPTFREWHKISTAVNITDIRIMIDDQSVMNITQTSHFAGSFGLGASFRQSAYFQNVTLNSFDGEVIYSSSLTEQSALADFLAGTNPEPVSVDGARRDRIAYAGDLDIALGSTFAATAGSEFINGSLNLVGSAQLLPGFFVPNSKIQQSPRTSEIQANQTGLIGYSFNLVTAMAEFYYMTGDVKFATRWAPAIVKMLDWANSQLTPEGLFNISDVTMGGDWNFYDPPQSGAVTKFNALYAFALQKVSPILTAANVSMQAYNDRLSALKAAINKNLWSPTLNAYQLSNSIDNTLAQDANAFAILASIPQGNVNSTTILATMSKELFVPAGAVAFSNSSSALGFAQMISPYSSGYHLRAAFNAHDEETIKHLLSTLWDAMASISNDNYTGCFWEALSINGHPGLGDSTSLCHAWASAPTGELSRNVLGIKAASPGFAEWSVVPQSLGLDWANGTHPTPYGDLSVSWAFDTQDFLSLNISSPNKTSGIVNLTSMLRHKNNATFMVNGKIISQSEINVSGGELFILQQVNDEQGNSGTIIPRISYFHVLSFTLSCFFLLT